jgi:hypothetical protein
MLMMCSAMQKYLVACAKEYHQDPETKPLKHATLKQRLIDEHQYSLQQCT